MPAMVTLPSINHIILQSIAMGLTVFLIPNLRVSSIFGPVLMVLSLAVLNATVWDFALFLSIPSTLTNQAGLLVLTNGALFWVLVKILPGIEVSGVLPALIAPLVFSVISVLIYQYGREIDWAQVWQIVEQLFGKAKQYFSPAISTPSSI